MDEVDSDAEPGEEERDLDEEGREVKRTRGRRRSGRGAAPQPAGGGGGGRTRSPPAPPSVPNPLAGMRGRSDSTGSQILTRSRSPGGLHVEDPLDSVGSGADRAGRARPPDADAAPAAHRPAAVTSGPTPVESQPMDPVSTSLNDPPAPPRRPSGRPASESMGEFADVAASMGSQDFGQDGLDAHHRPGDAAVPVPNAGGDGGRGRIFSIDLDRELLFWRGGWIPFLSGRVFSLCFAAILSCCLQTMALLRFATC